MFSNPLYLFSLAGLAIPIAIHLLSRKEGKVIKLGSLRHVVETSTQQFKGIKLNEIILLMLRCAMIIVFSLLLSGLQCSNQGKEKWVIVECGLTGFQNINSVLDSLKNDGYSMHLLSKGFPDLKDSSKSSGQVNYWELIDDLKQNAISQAIVFAKNNINNFKGQRSSLPVNVQWISQPLPEINFPLTTIRLKDDSVLVISGHSSADKTFFISKKISSKSNTSIVTAPDTIKVELVSDADFSYDHRIVKAILIAIEKLFPIRIELTETDPKNISPQHPNWCIWLSAKSFEGIRADNIISTQTQESNELIIQTEKNQWAITKRLNQEVVLKNNLTALLATLFLSEKKFEDKIMAKDRRMVSDSLVWRHQTVEGKEIQAAMHNQPADRFLIILLLVLLLTERIVAYRKNQ